MHCLIIKSLLFDNLIFISIYDLKLQPTVKNKTILYNTTNKKMNEMNKQKCKHWIHSVAKVSGGELLEI
jgi:hypothetical protein